MIPRRILYGLLLIGLFFFYIFFEHPISALLFSLAVAVPVCSLLCSLPLRRGLGVSLRVPESARRGTSVSVEVALTSRERPCVLPGSVRLTLSDRMGASRQKLKFRTPNDAGSRLSFRAEHCGVWNITITRAEVCDFLGLFRFRAPLPAPARLVVRPVPIPPDPAPDLSGIRSPSWQPKRGGGFSEHHELREYVPGDSLKTVHWKLSAKTDQLLVREAQEARVSRVLVTCALSADREETDRVLDSLVWLSEELLRAEVPHRILMLPASEHGSVPIDSRDDLDRLLGEILSAPPVDADPDEGAYPEADWHCALSPQKEVGS